MLDFSTTAPFNAQHATFDPRVLVAQPTPDSPSPAGEQVDLTDRLVSFEISNSIDNAAGQATVTFERGLGAESLSPLHDDSAMRYGNLRPYLDPHCALRIHVAVADSGTSSFQQLIFHGRIDSVDAAAGENLVRVHCRDFGGYLLNAQIPQVEIWGDGATDAEAVMAAILAAYDPNLNGFTTPFNAGASGFTLYPTPIGEISVLEALRIIAQQIGWDVRWFLSGGDTYGQLRFYDPTRIRSVLDWTFDVTQYERLTELNVDDADVRNRWVVHYQDPTTALPVEIPPVEDADSIARYGLRPARIYLQRAENIRDDAHATAYAAAALADNKDPLVSHIAQLPFFPPVELNDWVRFLNFDEYNGGISLAVAGYTHSWAAPQRPGEQGTATTTIQGRAAPIAAYRDYRLSVAPKAFATLAAPTTEYAREGTLIVVTDSLAPPV